MIDVARYKSLIEQSYSCTIRYFDRPDSFCELVTWPNKISDDTLAFLFNKCNLWHCHNKQFISTHLFTGTWVQDIFVSSFINVHLQRIWTRLTCYRVDILGKWSIVHKGVYFTTKHVKRCRCTFYWWNWRKKISWTQVPVHLLWQKITQL